ncbi:N-acetylneuraminate synthase [Clostridium sp. UBA5119]|uniref:N-acetylneuraminate synthase n=1 Tax=Clostridium sp. UBA5119 TaxID=1946366 RepID=UPI00321766EA
MSKKSVYIIAEAGVNHNGSIELAYKMVDVAVDAGVDAIKFQTFIAELGVSKFARMAEYQENNTRKKESQLEMVKKLELSFDEFKKIRDYCNVKGIEFLSTPFDLESVSFLNELGISAFKIPSGEITNLPYLRKVAQTGKKIIISTGMCNEEEISDALILLKSMGVEDITVLHCNTEYPTPMEDVNLKAMNTIKDNYNVKVGYSDHTLGIEVPVAAVALGAEVIEKHFTLDKTMEGPDHVASLDPNELKNMVKAIRNIEIALGNGIKKPSKSEIKNKGIARKSIVARIKIKEGQVFTEENLTVKRPGTGISPMRWDEVVGMTASRNYEEDEMIEI